MEKRLLPWMPDVTSWEAWREQLTQAATSPWLWRELTQRGVELFPRFTAIYRQLRRLPRRSRRWLQRKWACSLAGVALFLAMGHEPVLAATIPVDGVSCRLADAITAANADTTIGGCPAGSGSDELVLEPGSTHTLTTRNTSTASGNNGLPVITSVITIVGQGSTIARASGAPTFRLLEVAPSGDLSLDAVTLTGGLDSIGGGIINQGSLTLTNSTISNNIGNLGSGVANMDGVMNVIDSTISGNRGGTGGGVYNFRGQFSNSGVLTVSNSTISGNTAYGGGGVFSRRGAITMTDSTISDNRSQGILSDGGTLMLVHSTVSDNTDSGVAEEGPGNVTVTNSTITGNTGGAGGGIRVIRLGSTLTITNSTITGNTGGIGGGVFTAAATTISNSTISGNTATSKGGGVSTVGATTISNSTISGNTVTGEGGGVFNYGGLALTQSTVLGNTATGDGGGVFNAAGFGFAATLNLQLSLVSGNSASTGEEIYNASVTFDYGPPYVYTYSGILVADAFNLFGHSGTAGVEGFTPSATDVTPTVPLSAILDTRLADNGGPTLTHILVPGSPAIDAGENALAVDADNNPITTDQRGTGFPRISGCGATPTVDIGAVELQQVCNHPPVAHCHNVTVSTTPNTCTVVSASINNGSSDPDGDPLTFTQTPMGPYSLGATAVRLTASDGELSSACSGTVSVVDGQPPALTCPGNKTVTATSASGALVTFAVNASDNCGIVIPSCTPSSGSTFPVGSTSVTCTATDAAALQSSCRFTVTVTVTPLMQTTALITTVDGLPVSSAVKLALKAPLLVAKVALQANQPQVACASFKVFEGVVKQLRQANKLTASQATQLMTGSQSIRASLGCA